ncbi:hypothetical protein GCM10008959_09170 [Deinococcus seoulensis]|uniref:DUF3293 domain-containing protein n=1 Tax=Deinococcus seoulensis TaxID=1837379 RepID=A0ABQ2RQI1_9DEIO|nr:DUF3293 domain-containing protein [Deinococcus seoulensis]GGR50205.1 hypothetical protein GCM10008959_09170 [Deinococcus seoulensis]
MTAPPDTAWPDPALRAAFRTTRYGPPGARVTLTGEGPGLPGAPPDWTAGRWAIVTAWNPSGQRQSRVRNDAAHAALLAQATAWAGAPGRTVLEALNGEGEWREPSLVLRGPSLRGAARLGRAFGQAAVLYGCGARAALVWLPPGAELVRPERLWLRPVPAGQDVY